ncbi:hypothetical protein HDU92_000194, partial [Lobulomyces angularis]
MTFRCRCLWKGCNKAFEQESETYHHCLYVHSVTGKQQCQWVSNTNFVGCGH